jgi:hypothetical protein
MGADEAPLRQYLTLLLVLGDRLLIEMRKANRIQNEWICCPETPCNSSTL